MPNGVSPARASASLTSKLGGVPMRVTSPPSREPNETGMSSLEGTVFAPSARVVAAGIRITVAAMLFITADITPTINTSSAMRRRRPPPRRAIMAAIAAGTRASTRPALKTNMPATVITAGLLNPLNTRSGVTRPAKATASNASTPTKSGRTRSLAKSARAPPSTPMRIQASVVMALQPSCRVQAMG